MRTVTLTNEQGERLGEQGFLEAHTNEGSLHLAFSVYVFSPDKKKFLMQKRAAEKMLFAGCWANTCCSHPFPDEAAESAGERRLKEELGISVKLQKGPTFTYRAEDPNGNGVEHEFVQILVGEASTEIEVIPDPKEVEEYRWIGIEEMQKDMKMNPTNYAPWFHLGLKKVLLATRQPLPAS